VARRLAKAFVGAALSTLARLSRRRVGVALLYHSIADTGRQRHDELVPATRPTLFARQLDMLRRRFVVVPASELQKAVAARRWGGRIPVAITFDDDDHSHPSTAAPLLREAGLTATFFVNGESLERPRPLWWQQLQRAWDERAVDAELLESIGIDAEERLDLEAIGAAATQLRPEQREALRDRLSDQVGDDPALSGISREELQTLVDAGFEIGCHTLRHDFLPLLSEAELGRSIRGGREEVAAISGKVPACFAYPSGGWDAPTRSAVSAAGFRFAFTASGGVITPSADPLALPRVPPPTGHAAELSMEIGRALWGWGHRAP
jgi:peptidoglycan/xylan/chitin deacetylase (PgdA/CDA1 family)